MINTTYCQLMVTNVVKSSPSTEPSWWPPGDCSGSSPRYLSIEALPAVFEVPGHLGALGGDVWNPQKRCRKGMMCLKSLHLYCYSEYSWVYFWSDFTFYVFLFVVVWFHESFLRWAENTNQIQPWSNQLPGIGNPWESYHFLPNSMMDLLKISKLFQSG